MTEGTPEEQKEGRDYTRSSYQNLMTVVDLLDKQSPLPMTQKQILNNTGLSKNVVFDVCWNLVKRGWAEDTGDGAIKLKKIRDEKAAWVGRMVTRAVRDAYGVHIDE
jgi:DNA-binding IclR family transcriptional regulator